MSMNMSSERVRAALEQLRTRLADANEDFFFFDDIPSNIAQKACDTFHIKGAQPLFVCGRYSWPLPKSGVLVTEDAIHLKEGRSEPRSLKWSDIRSVQWFEGMDLYVNGQAQSMPIAKAFRDALVEFIQAAAGVENPGNDLIDFQGLKQLRLSRQKDAMQYEFGPEAVVVSQNEKKQMTIPLTTLRACGVVRKGRPLPGRNLPGMVQENLVSTRPRLFLYYTTNDNTIRGCEILTEDCSVDAETRKVTADLPLEPVASQFLAQHFVAAGLPRPIPPRPLNWPVPALLDEPTKYSTAHGFQFDGVEVRILRKPDEGSLRLSAPAEADTLVAFPIEAIEGFNFYLGHTIAGHATNSMYLFIRLTKPPEVDYRTGTYEDMGNSKDRKEVDLTCAAHLTQDYVVGLLTMGASQAQGQWGLLAEVCEYAVALRQWDTLIGRATRVTVGR